MYLKTLILTGFKSFPEKIRLEFNTGITAVVGPNGSGKSNISDAVRWVLGEQSAKSLRGGKMEDIIFSGTENRRPLAFAEVSMVIDNADHRMRTEYSEITVTRRMYRSGEGEYRINGVSSRLKDIHELFMDTGVGREGYSIIGQGNIEEILGARSDERRLLFEEAAGIVKYKTRRQETYVKLERERQNLLRVTDVIAELELQLPQLAEQSQKARHWLDLKEQLKIVQVNIFLSQIQSSDKQLAGLEEQIRVLSSQQESEQAKHDNQSRLYERLQSDLTDTEDLLGRLAEEKEDARLKAEQAEVTIKVTEERVNNMSAAEERLKAQINKNNSQAVKKRQALNDERVKESALETEFVNLNDRLKSGQSTFDLLSEGLSERDQELERLNALIMDRMKASLELKNRIERIESQIDLLTERKDTMRSEGEACDSQIFNVNTLLNRERSELTITVNNMDGCLARIQELQKHAAGLNRQYEQAAADEAEIIKRLNEAESRHSVLADMERGFEGYRRSSKAILKNRDVLKGILGAVGELTRTPERFETAIETALGSSLNDIVTETEEDAIEAIGYLKRTREGRAAFLPLNAINPRGLGKDKEAVVGEPGVVGPANTLISYDPIYERIFLYLLGAVIVVDSTEAAIRISRKYKQGLMIVTLDGEQFNPGGPITGGSVSAHSGLINRTRELDELKRLIVELKKQNGTVSQNILTIKEEIAAGANETEEVRGKWQALLLENNTRQIKCRQLEETYSELSKKLRNISQEFEKQTAKENEAYNALTPLQTEANAIEREVKALRVQIDAHSRSVSGDRQKHEEQVKELTDLKIRAGRVEQQHQACKDAVLRMESELDGILADKAALERELLSGKEKRLEFAETVKLSETSLEESRMRLSGISGQIESAAGLRDKLREQISESERRRRAGMEMLAGLSNEVSLLGLRKEQIEAETRKLYDEMWDEYQVTAQTAKAYKTPDQPISQLNREERRLKNEIAETGAVNVGAIDEYKAISERYHFLDNQRKDILSAEEKLLSAISELTGLMEQQFTAQFTAISQNFNLVFRDMFSGGKARLVLSGSGNILESGIEIEAQPPGKTLQNMTLLSGGERALTAAALLFGILRLKPSPFCILDEIEAALDEANVIRFADYIRKISIDTQFILITHRKGTMEAANVLYGVTMQEAGVSKLVSVRLEEATA